MLMQATARSALRLSATVIVARTGWSALPAKMTPSQWAPPTAAATFAPHRLATASPAPALQFVHSASIVLFMLMALDLAVSVLQISPTALSAHLTPLPQI